MSVRGCGSHGLTSALVFAGGGGGAGAWGWWLPEAYLTGVDVIKVITELDFAGCALPWP